MKLTKDEMEDRLRKSIDLERLNATWDEYLKDPEIPKWIKDDLWTIFNAREQELKGRTHKKHPPTTRQTKEGMGEKKGEGMVPPSPEKEERKPESGGKDEKKAQSLSESNGKIPVSPQTSLAVPMELRRFSIEAVEVAVNNADDIGRMMEKKMKKDHHYGLIPGARKDSLWQPGADLILSGFRYYDEPFHTERTEDEDGHIRITIYSRIHPLGHPEITISVGVGAASSRETKYAYRWVKEDEIPKGFEKDSLKVRNGKYDKLYRIPNQDIGELENTLLKMARKRSKVSGVMALPGCSELFKD